MWHAVLSGVSNLILLVAGFAFHEHANNKESEIKAREYVNKLKQLTDWELLKLIPQMKDLSTDKEEFLLLEIAHRWVNSVKPSPAAK